MITRAKISAVRANSFVVLEQFIVFFLVIRNSSNKRRIGGAALIRGRRVLTFLSQMRRLFEGGAYSNKYGMHNFGGTKIKYYGFFFELANHKWGLERCHFLISILGQSLPFFTR